MKRKFLLICIACYCVSSTLIGQDFEITSYTFDKKVNKNEFLSLFGKSNSIVTYGLSITDKKNNKLLYSYSVHAGTVKIAKINDSTFFLIGSTAFPYADVYASFEIGKHILKIKGKGLSLEIDKAFSNYPKLDSVTLKNIPIKYNRMKRDSSFAGKDWDKITKQNSDSVQNLSYVLTLGILNGCKECVPLFQSMRKDFDIINAGAGSEYLMGCENVLELYGYIKEKK